MRRIWICRQFYWYLFGLRTRLQVQNIDDVLQRGTVLSELDTKTQNLSMLSQKYKKDATYLNRKSMYVKMAAAAIVFFVFILYFWIL